MKLDEHKIATEQEIKITPHNQSQYRGKSRREIGQHREIRV